MLETKKTFKGFCFLAASAFSLLFVLHAEPAMARSDWSNGAGNHLSQAAKTWMKSITDFQHTDSSGKAEKYAKINNWFKNKSRNIKIMRDRFFGEKANIQSIKKRWYRYPLLASSATKYEDKYPKSADPDADDSDEHDSDSDGSDGDGSDKPPMDSDGDGIADSADQCPGQDDTVDRDKDGTPDCMDKMIDSDGDGYSDADDCAPTNPAINPGASEICDGIDNNCSGQADDGLTFSTYYQDSDADQYGNAQVSEATCNGAPAGYVMDNTDCNDSAAGINPGATEIPCDGIDQSCSGADEIDATCADTDNDGYSDVEDCAPADPTINPGASEIACDGIDQDCSGADEINATCTDTDNDGFSDAEDCAPKDATINPGASEICDGIDNNCSGEVDEGLNFTTYYQDNDSDLFGNDQVSQTTCDEAPAGYIDNANDCNDTDAGINPNATEVACDGIDQDCSGADEIDATCTDTDNDGYSDATDCAPNDQAINPGATDIACDGIDQDCSGADAVDATCTDTDGDGFSDANDCAPTDPAINPGASEICDGIDNNCSGEVDEGLDFTTYYQDNDSDLFGNDQVSQTTCDGAPAGYVENANDCNDTDAGINPNGTEVACDGIDQDCSGADEIDATCTDTDNDGYSDATDCAPNDPAINPGATDIACDDIDQDCSGADEVNATCTDTDGDGFSDADDCAPTDPAINPGASEICDGIDNNCSGEVDDGLNFTTYYQDSDSDLFGNDQVSQTTCDGAPAGYVENANDCNDTDAGINPNGTEVACDGIDQDCSGADEIDATCTDTDGDGFSDADDCAPADPAINPGAEEICDGIDNNCSGQVDDGLTFTTYYQDSDTDQYGNAQISETTCNGAPAGYVLDDTDCNDGAAGINPGATEIPCDGIDQDCSGADEIDATCTDTDGDGFSDAGDCAPNDPAINPGATDIACDGIDQDCSGADAVDATCTDTDGDGFSDADDCAPTDPAINPGASEICDGIDNNCSGEVDEGLNFTTYYQDNDSDLFGNDQVSQTTCDGAPAGYVENANDCNDTDAGINPNGTEIACDGIDQDCSGADEIDATCTDTDNDGFSDADDCAPNDPAINPGATEIACDGIDQDCSGADELDATCTDTDGDGFSDADDCAPNDPAINPGATDIACDGIDQDCSGTDEVDATCTDTDGDGFSDADDCAPNDPAINPGATDIACDGIDQDCSGADEVDATCTDTDGDGFSDADDCAPNDPAINPGATEIACDGIDQDCSGADELDATCTDTDGDGFSDADDCEPTDPEINPGAIEICDGFDNNCSGQVDEGLTFTTYYQDSDGDNYGNSQISDATCNSAPIGYVLDNTDCNDGDNGINPGAAEIPCDGIDQNCDLVDATDATCTDTDGDGVPDSADQCPGEDDTIDINNDSIPDCLQANNQAPTIDLLTVETSPILVGDTTLVTGEVSDPEGDQVTVNWSTVCPSPYIGSIVPVDEGGGVYFSSFSAPASIGGLPEIQCDVTLEATDSLGNSSTATDVVIVRSPPSEICTIEGKVYGTSGTPMSNQTVTLSGTNRTYERTVTTDSNGNYAFDDVTCCQANSPGFNGKLKVAFTRSNPDSTTSTWNYSREVLVDCSTVVNGTTCSRDIVLPTIWGTLQGTFFDANGNPSSAPVLVALTNEEGAADYFPSISTSFRLSGNGNYGPVSVPLGESTLMTPLSFDNFNLLHMGQFLRKDIGPGVTGTINGVAFKDNGSRNGSAQVQLGFSGPTTVTDAIGRYSFANVSGNNQAVTTSAPLRAGYGSINQKDEVAVIDIMGSGCEIGGMVYDQFGAPFNLATPDLILFVDNELNPPAISSTAASGQFTMNGARSGSGELSLDLAPPEGFRYFDLNTCAAPISVDIQVYPDATCGNGH